MIIMDYSQVSISNLMIQKEIDIDFARHMILNSIRSYRQKFSKVYGELVIACDDKNYWRKDIFPYYKAHRKDDREKSSINWDVLFDSLHIMKRELREVFPYKVIQADRAEADDIVATLCHRFGKTLNGSDEEKILILSADHDFAQLQHYSNVEQYDPIRNRWIKEPNPERYLKEHIIRGDRGDGIPNILSSDACIVSKERQKPVTSKKLSIWVEQDPVEFCDTIMLRNYSRNNSLVNLFEIPKNIQENINSLFDKYEVPSRKGMMNYFIKNRLKNLLGSIQEF